MQIAFRVVRETGDRVSFQFFLLSLSKSKCKWRNDNVKEWRRHSIESLPIIHFDCGSAAVERKSRCQLRRGGRVMAKKKRIKREKVADVEKSFSFVPITGENAVSFFIKNRFWSERQPNKLFKLCKLAARLCLVFCDCTVRNGLAICICEFRNRTHQQTRPPSRRWAS